MKDLKFICAQPDDTYYTWQVHAWLESLKSIGHSDKAIVLVYTPSFREKSDKWQKIQDLYPEAEFAYYKDGGDVSQQLGTYIPVLRPYSLMRYFQDNPEMSTKAVFYCDCDILFTDNIEKTKFNYIGKELNDIDTVVSQYERRLENINLDNNNLKQHDNESDNDN